MKKLIAVVGTNASGKSGLGIALARRYGGEVVSADSRQVYRGLDLGSGKVTPEEIAGVPHHLLDVCEPGAFFTMADFQRLAYAAIEEIHSRGRLPFLVGGTGLYVDAVCDGYVLSNIEPDLSYRRELEKLEREIGRLEAQIAALTAREEQNATDYQKLMELGEEKAALQETLDGLYLRWEELAE